MRAAVILFNLLLIGLLFTTPRRSPALLAGALLGLILSLVWQSTPRLVGDSGEYVAMSLNLARAAAPSLTQDDLDRAAALFPGEAGVRLVQPQFRARDGRQDFSHFWFYSLLAAPLVGLATAVGAHPVTGFAVLNIVLLLGASRLMRAHLSPATTLLLAAGPILWWVDKAHTEVFTFSLLATAIVLLRSAPWWSVVAFGASATQNPPIAGAMIIAGAYAFRVFGWRDRRVWAGLATGSALASLHPLYYHERLGVWSTLRDGMDPHWPSLRELITVPIDPNIGMLVHDPFFAVALGFAVIAAMRREPRSLLSDVGAAVTIIALLFLAVFTQTANVNSGGTPSPSRYGLWLLPLAIPAFETVPAAAVSIRLLTAASVVWCSVHFAPRLPDDYLTPTSLAETLWLRWPGVDNPLAEVFAERVSRQEPSPPPPLSTAGCEKILLVGNGTTAAWPAGCTPTTLPRFCRDASALCYANKTTAVYTFTRAPSPPAWRRERAEPGPATPTDEQARAGYVLPPTEKPELSLWLDAGWSYLEQAPDRSSPKGTIEWRWMADEATVGMIAAGPATVRLKIVAQAFKRIRRLRLSMGGAEVITLDVSPQRADYVTPPFRLAPGANILKLESLDRAESPGGQDLRRLSVSVFHIELVTENR